MTSPVGVIGLLLVVGCRNPNHFEPVASGRSRAESTSETDVRGPQPPTDTGRGSAEPGRNMETFVRLKGDAIARAKARYQQGDVVGGRKILSELLRDPDWNTRSLAVRAAVAVQDSGLLPALHDALRDERLEVRESASRGLQELGDSTSIEPLKRALDDDAFIVRSNAVGALVKLMGDQAIGLLIDVLGKDRDVDVRATAIDALSEFRDARIVRKLSAVLLSGENSLLRIRAAVALGNQPDPAAAQALKRAANDPDSGVRAAVAEALERIAELQGQP